MTEITHNQQNGKGKEESCGSLEIQMSLTHLNIIVSFLIFEILAVINSQFKINRIE